MTRPLLSGKPSMRRGLFAAAFTGLPLLPMSIGRLLAVFGAWAAWWVDGSGRRVVARNLAPLAGRRGRVSATAVRRSYLSFLLAAVDSLHLHRFTAAGNPLRHFPVVMDRRCIRRHANSCSLLGLASIVVVVSSVA